MYERLDFSTFYRANDVQRHDFCLKLVSTLQRYGFARLTNTGVPSKAIDAAFDASRTFFRLPLDQKLKSPHPPTAVPHRGYTAIGIENVSAASASKPLLRDMKESYDIGSQTDQLYANIWPPAGVYDDFEATLTSFFSTCYRAELDILEAISIGLGIPSLTLGRLHAQESNELRLTHYPAVSRDQFAHSTRIAAHTDFGTITLLFQDDVGGLQVESPPGSSRFVDVDSGGRHECILNVGDCLHKWTGLPSVTHRVHLPKSRDTVDEKEGGNVINERYSIAYFAKPDRGASLCPLLDQVVEPENNGFYMTAGEFQLSRIQGTYS